MNDERVKFWDFVIDKGIATSDRLRKKLSIDESNFKSRVSYGHANPRDYFAYRVLDEVQKAATRFIQWKDFFSSKGERLQEHESAEQIFRVTLQGVYDEVNLRVRKLTELMAQLILFGYTNEQAYYKDYLCFSEIIAYMNDQSDREEFYAYKSSNAEDYINELKSIIKSIETNGLDSSKRWYLKEIVSIDKMPRPRYSDFRERYRKILSYGKADEITLIGKSYRHAYGESDYVHFSYDEHVCIFNEDALLLKVDKAAILIINILTKLNNLLGGVLGSEDSDLLNLSDEIGKKAYLEWTTSKAKPGDYVAIGQDIGIVLEENKSKYGFFSYKIKYLSEPPLPHITEDSFAVFEVFKLGSRKDLTEMILECYRKAGVEIEAAKIEALDDKFFNNTLAECFKKTYEAFMNSNNQTNVIAQK
jgi:hypothetical protein